MKSFDEVSRACQKSIWSRNQRSVISQFIYSRWIKQERFSNKESGQKDSVTRINYFTLLRIFLKKRQWFQLKFERIWTSLQRVKKIKLVQGKWLKT